MKRATILFVIAALVLGLSSVVQAEVVISQNFDDTTTFPNGAYFTDTGASNGKVPPGLGDSTTTAGEWIRADFNETYVTNAQSSSGTQSATILRATGSPKVYGYTTRPGTPIGSGLLEASTRVRVNSDGSAFLFLANTTPDINDPQLKWPVNTYYNFVGIADNGEKKGLKASGWDSDQGKLAYGDYVDGLDVPVDTWVGVKMVVDLDAKLYDVWYDGGSGYTEVISDVALQPGAIAINCFGSSVGSPSTSQVWLDDVLVETVPEPGTLALLTAGLIGLLCYAWRKRK